MNARCRRAHISYPAAEHAKAFARAERDKDGTENEQMKFASDRVPRDLVGAFLLHPDLAESW